MQRNPSLYLHIHCRAINIFISHDSLPSVWPCSSVGVAAVIKSEGRGFKSHPGQSFPLSLCGAISICRANAQMVWNTSTLHHILSLYLFLIQVLHGHSLLMQRNPSKYIQGLFYVCFFCDWSIVYLVAWLFHIRLLARHTKLDSVYFLYVTRYALDSFS